MTNFEHPQDPGDRNVYTVRNIQPGEPFPIKNPLTSAIQVEALTGIQGHELMAVVQVPVMPLPNAEIQSSALADILRSQKNKYGARRNPVTGQDVTGFFDVFIFQSSDDNSQPFELSHINSPSNQWYKPLVGKNQLTVISGDSLNTFLLSNERERTTQTAIAELEPHDRMTLLTLQRSLIRKARKEPSFAKASTKPYSGKQILIGRSLALPSEYIITNNPENFTGTVTAEASVLLSESRQGGLTTFVQNRSDEHAIKVMTR